MVGDDHGGGNLIPVGIDHVAEATKVGHGTGAEQRAFDGEKSVRADEQFLQK